MNKTIIFILAATLAACGRMLVSPASTGSDMDSVMRVVAKFETFEGLPPEPQDMSYIRGSLTREAQEGIPLAVGDHYAVVRENGQWSIFKDD